MSFGFCQQLPNLFVRRLREVVVPQTDSVERLRRDRADHFLDLVPELIACFGSRCWNSDDDPCRLLLSERLRGGSHRRSGRQAVVDENDSASTDIGWLRIAAIQSLAALELILLADDGAIDRALRYPERANDVVIDDTNSAAADCPHRKLLVSGNAELTNEKDVEWRAQLCRDFIRDRHSAAGEGEDEDVVAIGELAKIFGEDTARVGAITKRTGEYRRHGVPSSVSLCAGIVPFRGGVGGPLTIDERAVIGRCRGVSHGRANGGLGQQPFAARRWLCHSSRRVAVIEDALQIVALASPLSSVKSSRSRSSAPRDVS